MIAKTRTLETITSHCLSSDNNNNDDVCMSDCFHSLIVPVEVYHIDNPNDTVSVYALIDEQSDACFVIDGVLRKLNIAARPWNSNSHSISSRRDIM